MTGNPSQHGVKSASSMVIGLAVVHGDLRDGGLWENDGGTREPRQVSQQIRVSGFHRSVRPL